ncbi:MAG: BACON domain-containing protein [Bacteroidaceae bacterium]|nr:BACON domain-containing protein [Bacteroidaceae bacterium]
MKKLFNIILLAFSFTLFFSCKPEEKVIDLITIDQNNWVAESTGGTLSLNLSATYDWTASADANWLNISMKKGVAGDIKINIRASQNYSGETRTGTVRFVSSEGAETVLSVEQKRNLVLDLSSMDFLVEAQGEVISLDLISNLDYEISIDEGKDWIHLEDTKGIVSYTHQFRIDPNESKVQRVGKISLTDPTENVTQTVVILQKAQPDMIGLVYDGESLDSPVLSGNDASAIIDWGDDMIDTISVRQQISHRYESVDTWNVSIRIANAESIKFNDIKGISSIDLSEFAVE